MDVEVPTATPVSDLYPILHNLHPKMTELVEGLNPDVVEE